MKEDVIKLVSRDGTENFLVKVSDKQYSLKTPYCYRAGTLQNNKKFIDPSGGPMLIEGEFIPEAGFYIDTINGNLITVK